MKCRTHPSMKCLPRKSICTLCEDWTQTSAIIESDLASARYEQMSQHVQPGIQGIRSRRQYQRLLKSRGLTDDITTKELIACNRDRSRRERYREQQIRTVTHRLMGRAQAQIAQSPSNPIPRTESQRALLAQLRRVFA